MRRFDDRHILLFYKGPKVYSSHVDARESDHPATRQRQSGHKQSLDFLDGYIGTSIVRECLKADLLALLMKMSNESHVKSPYVTYLMVCGLVILAGLCVLCGPVDEGGFASICSLHNRLLPLIVTPST
uniref:Uncharacterized protein n=1 Tax=Oryza nivara TaxID=4536 RepID=A0A0E0I258_ORYNI